MQRNLATTLNLAHQVTKASSNDGIPNASFVSPKLLHNRGVVYELNTAEAA
jgi:hypothetical protein